MRMKRGMIIGMVLGVLFLVAFAVRNRRHGNTNVDSSPPAGLTRGTAAERSRQLFRRPGLGTGLIAGSARPLPPVAAAVSTLAQATVEERMALNDELLALTAPELFGRWIEEAHSAGDLLRLEFIAGALVFRLRDGGTELPAVVTAMMEFAELAENEPYHRWQIIATLGEAATPQTMEVLLEAAASADADLRLWSISWIARLGDQKWAGRYHEELSTGLENAWSHTTDERLKESIGLSLARVGAPSAVRLLLTDVLVGGRTIEEFEVRKTRSALVAFDALSEVTNPTAVPVLAEAIRKGGDQEMTVVAAWASLSHMGLAQASAELLLWTQEALIDVGAFPNEWVLMVRDEASVPLIANAVTSGVFANEANRARLRESLDQWRRDRHR